MEREFVTYEIALALKELGFDEECFSFYEYNGELYKSEGYYKRRYNVNEHNEVIAPTYSQAFRFFREKYNLFGKFYIINFGADEYSFNIYDLYEEKYKYENFIGAGASYTGTFDTYEEAELECLIKLIEIVKSK